MAAEPSVVETQAISFVFQVALALLTLLVTILLVFVWSMSKDIKANTAKNAALELKIAVKKERDIHIDDQLVAIRKSVKDLDTKFDKVIQVYNNKS